MVRLHSRSVSLSARKPVRHFIRLAQEARRCGRKGEMLKDLRHFGGEAVCDGFVFCCAGRRSAIFDEITDKYGSRYFVVYDKEASVSDA